MAGDLWTREQRLAAVEALARIPRGQLGLHMAELSRAVGRVVTVDSIRHAFKASGLNPPSAYMRDPYSDDAPATPRSVETADTDRPTVDPDGHVVLSVVAQAEALRAHQAKLRADADAVEKRISALGAAPPVAVPLRGKAASVEALYQAIKGSPVSLVDLCNKLDLSPAKATSLIEEATAKGIDVHLENDHVGFRSKTPGDRVHDTEIPPVVGSRQLVGVISDTHLGSKWCLRSRLIDFVQHAYSRGVREILHPGDMLDGQYHHSTFEVSHVGLDAQIEDLFETLPQLPGLTYHAIAGNHDHTFTAKSGVNVGRAIVAAFRDKGRDDFRYYGERSAYLRVRGALVHLWHPGGGGSYARSYKLQKRVENYSSGEKPSIMLAGHWHQFCHVYERGVHAIACPTFHGGGSEFSNMLGTSQAIGGLLLSWESTAGGTLRNFAVEPRLYFERERVHTITEADEDAA